MNSTTETASDGARNACRSGQITETVVTAVAEAKGVDPLELEPLYTVIDPDALNSIFRPSVGSPSATVELSFSMAGCDVVVHDTGDVVVTPPAETDESPPTVTPLDD